MPNLTYQTRPSLASHNQEYSLTDTALIWSGGVVPFNEVHTIRIYSVPGMQFHGQTIGALQRCAIQLNSGKLIQISSQNFLGPGKVEDRSPALTQFAGALAARVRASNPSALFLAGMPPVLWCFWFLTLVSIELALILCIVFGLVGLTMAHQNTPGTFGLFLLLAIMLIGPFTFLRAIWRRRTRPLDPARISGVR